MRNAVELVIEKLGGPTKAANALGVSNPSVVANWRSRGRVPAERVIEIEGLTGISRHDLRPDVFGPNPVTSPSPHDVDRVATAGPDGGPSESGPAFSQEAAE